MKRIVRLGLVLLLGTHQVLAADMELTIELPDVELMLPPVSPPQLQKEGLPLVQERETVETLLDFIGRGAYDEAMAYLREHQPMTLDLLESGDPDGLLKNRAVVGGVMPTTRNGAISATLLYLIGHVYVSLEDYAPAETAFLSALGPVPDYIRVHESLGLLYLRTGRYEAAVEHLAHAAELGLHTGNLFGALGYLNYQLGNFWGAASAFQEALMLVPDSTQFKRGLLNSLSRTYQYRSVMTLAESMLKDDPDSEELWLYRANAALQAGENQAALASLETAIRLGDDTAANLQVCATLHMEIGSVARAVDLLKAGFAKGLNFAFIDQGMSWLQQQEEWDFLEQMIDSVRDDWDELDALQQSRVLLREADLHQERGDLAAAREALEQAIDLDPTNAGALMSLAKIHQDNGDYNRAELLYQRASAFDDYRQNALISLAQLALDQDDYERALQTLRDVTSEFPERTDLARNIESLENLVRLQSEN
jgi:tetratricopeptide (TPR) repeat protein